MATQQAKPANAVSLRPSGFAQGGGLLSDADITVTRARFGLGYGNDSAADAVTLGLTMEDSDGATHTQYWSCGKGFVPSEVGDEEYNGLYLVPVSDKTSPSASSNFAMAITSLVNAGLPEDILDGPISALEGLKAHVDRIPAPKRAGIVRQGANAEREQTILVFTKIIALPGEAAPAPAKVTPIKGTAGRAATKAEPKAEAKGSAFAGRIAEELIGAMATAGVDELKKVQIVTTLFKSIPSTDTDKKAILADAGKDEVLHSLDGFTFDGAVLKMA